MIHDSLRDQFPQLDREVHGHRLAYLDSAASSLTPRSVIDAIVGYYQSSSANVHRGMHLLSAEATDAYEGARTKVGRFIGADHESECVFVRGATEGINLVAQCYLRPRLQPGDEILITAMEHHANIVPWQMVRDAIGGVHLRIVAIHDDGTLDQDAVADALGPRTRLLAVSHVSNALGTVNPIEWIVERAHANGTPVLVDGAQWVPHYPLDVAALDVDFYTFSAHKMFGPKGVGVLYGKKSLLCSMPPYQGGGDMIRSVTFEKTTFADPPARFEAGTPNIVGVIGLGAAIDWLGGLDRVAIAAHEERLKTALVDGLSACPDIRLIGTAPHRVGVQSFVLAGVHPHDVGTILDREGVAVRVGHHCAQPLMERYGVPATVRASIGPYNVIADVEQLLRGLDRVREIFGCGSFRPTPTPT